MVGRKVHTLDDASITAILDLLLQSPETVRTLIMKERGNVVVQLFSMPKADQFRGQLDALFQQIAQLYLQVALDKMGALALTRLHDGVPPNSIYRHGLDALTLQHFDAVVRHRFGNFLVSQLIKMICSASPANRQRLASIFCDPARFVQICCDKFGAHTAEVWAVHATEAEFCQTLQGLVRTRGAVWALANDVSSNNPLQRLLVRMYQGRWLSHSISLALLHLWQETHAVVVSQAQGACFERMVTATLNGRGRVPHQ
jgi:hypothetical protein